MSQPMNLAHLLHDLISHTVGKSSDPTVAKRLREFISKPPPEYDIETGKFLTQEPPAPAPAPDPTPAPAPDPTPTGSHVVPEPVA